MDYDFMIEKIRSMAELMDETGLTGLSIEENDTKIKLERRQAPPVPAAEVQHVSPAAMKETEELQSDGAQDVPGTVTVMSPMVGVFYATASPESKPLVSVGDKVGAGDVLCIIEAMKLMNEVICEHSGTVSEICVGNGQVVEFGQPLFRIKL